MNGKLQLKCNLNLKAVIANILKSVMEYQLEQNLPAVANKVKSVKGVSTQARSPMEVGTEMKSVMKAVNEKTNLNPCLKVTSEIFFFFRAMGVSTEMT